MEIDKKDIQVILGNTRFKMRSVILLETKDGILLEKNKKGYLFVLGGKMMTMESSIDTAVREIKEEIDLDIDPKYLQLISVIENFYRTEEHYVHEVSFVYRYKLRIDFECDNESDFIIIPRQDLSKYDIRPKEILPLLSSEDYEDTDVKHIISRI